jgi:hypothetical protein
MRKITPFVLVAMLVGSAIFFAISCKGSTVAFNNDGQVASLNVEVAGTPSPPASQPGQTE